MKEKLLRQLEAQRSVMGVMENNLQVWQSVKEIRKNYDTFVRNIKKIGDCLAVTGTDLEPLKEKMRLSRESTIGHLLPIAGVMEVFAGDTGDRKLAKIAKATIKSPEKMKTSSLRKYCLEVLKRASGLLESPAAGTKGKDDHHLSGYGLTVKHIQRLQESSDFFCHIVDNYEEALEKRDKYETRLERYIQDNKMILTRKLDRTILLFRDSHKEFHDSYFRARFHGGKKHESLG